MIEETVVIEIYWNDLTSNAQQQIANQLGYASAEECAKFNNWGVDPLPLATLEFEIEGSEDDE